ncbi:uncharacterized protein EDB91DRAFT_1245193 [Suillus paluster]|uniref:uncharacterized protein n=1 Tax=Suillus paluster TaxID=48578 RepID=UPI001B85E1CF|nr:uncharacterized protein EDB91DRAFT_1245193 [Suillus paluster]KAG1748493.1 hypothetical protein EDB91DRAFT_1245193 [Suillus paluster]
MRQKRCTCQAYRCNGVLIPEHTARAHERRDLREKTAASQAQFKRVGERFVPSAAQEAGPVPRGYSVPLHDPQPLLSPDVQFHDPHRILESPVEQEMLDYGFLTGEDVDLMTHGSNLPNLGPNFHSPEALHDAVDHFSAYNAASSSSSRPLTSYEAHHLPHDPEQRALDREIEKAVEAIRNEDSQVLQHEDGLDDLDIDVNGIFDDQDNQDNNVMSSTDPNEDDPDPFLPEEGFNSTRDRDLTDTPPHLITIYALVSWLHLQFHLPRAACNALLATLGCILVALSPAIDTPFITLQSSHRVLLYRLLTQALESVIVFINTQDSLTYVRQVFVRLCQSCDFRYEACNGRIEIPDLIFKGIWNVLICW